MRPAFMSDILHRCMTKATTAEGDDVCRGLGWVLSRRGKLKVATDSLVCGIWYFAITVLLLVALWQCPASGADPNQILDTLAPAHPRLILNLSLIHISEPTRPY